MKIGIDIGGSHIGVGLIKESGKILEKREVYIVKSSFNSSEEIKEYIRNSIPEMIDEIIIKYNIENIELIGISAPGNVRNNKIEKLVNLGIESLDLVNILENKYKCRVIVRNDGKCAGIAEKLFGELKNYSDAIFLCIGTGVGSAVFMNNQLLVPKNNTGFEIGHMIINPASKIECNCGKNGCFETFVSMKRLNKKIKAKIEETRKMKPNETHNYIKENLNDERIQKIIEYYKTDLYIGLSNLINIFEPEIIVFGGSFSYYSDIFLENIEEKIKPYLFNKDTKIKYGIAKLKNDAGIIGSVEEL